RHTRFSRDWSSDVCSSDLAALILLVACLLALSINGKVLFWLLLYLGSTLLYSFWLKRQPMFDVVTLAGLYTLRVEIGAAATGIEVGSASGRERGGVCVSDM